MVRRAFLAYLAIFAVALSASTGLEAQTVAGRWLMDVTLDAGSGQATFNFEVQGTTLTGTYGGVLGEQAVTGTIEGNVIRFGFESPDAGEIEFDGILEGDRLEGTCVYGALGNGTFIANRQS